MKNCVEALRKEYHIRQETLATAMGVSRQTISSIEKGKYNPSIVLAMHIARYFGRPVEEIFSDEETVLWKTADALRNSNKCYPNDAANTAQTLPDTVIYSQNAMPFAALRYGDYPLSFNGGEAIAVYNAERLCGRAFPLADILLEFEGNGLSVLRGLAGTDPKKLPLFFAGHNEAARVFQTADALDEGLSNGSVFLLSYRSPQLLSQAKGLHTVAGQATTDGILLYNVAPSDTEATAYPSASAFLSGKTPVLLLLLE